MTEIPPGAIIITTREIYDELKGIREDLKGITAIVPSHSEQLDDHETRMRSLEKAKYWIAGMSAALGAGAVEALSRIPGL